MKIKHKICAVVVGVVVAVVVCLFVRRYCCLLVCKLLLLLLACKGTALKRLPPEYCKTCLTPRSLKTNKTD